MKKTFILLLLSIITFHVKAIDFYKGSYNQALKEAEKTNKLVLLYFTANWCGPCQYMSRYIFNDPLVQQMVSKNYIVLKLDVDIEENKVIYYKYNSDKGVSVPKFFFITSKEEVIKSQAGSQKLGQFKRFIEVNNWSESISKAASDSIAQSRIKRNAIKPTTFNKFLYNSMCSKWKPGIRIGINSHGLDASRSNTNYNKNKLGFNLGLFIEYETRHFLFQPGISFCSKGAKTSNPSEKIKLKYLELPVKFSINTFRHSFFGRQSVRFHIEPYAAYALTGKAGDRKINFGSSAREWNRFDYGLKTGFSLQLGTFEPSFGYDFGLHNLSNQSGEKIYNRGFYFNIALAFGK